MSLIAERIGIRSKLPDKEPGMVNEALLDEWNFWTDYLDPQEFMDSSRASGHSTIGAAVDAFVVEIPGMDPGWAGINAEELEEIRDTMMSYLFLTRGIGWK